MKKLKPGKDFIGVGGGKKYKKLAANADDWAQAVRI